MTISLRSTQSNNRICGLLTQIRPALERVKHHRALPWGRTAGVHAGTGATPRRAARLLRLLILTATRANEVRYAQPGEFDLHNRVWSIPGDRTKSGRPLRVPLCEQAIDIVRSALPKAKYGYLYPGCKEGPVAAWDHREWIPVDVPRLGGGVHGIPGFARGRGVSSRYRFADGGRLPASRSA
ncbi:hypothetical protein [Paraburkholderia panacisoli]|uniref:hypothetical protein n=1 Tax=Paraburkholderia panacisoli TaxID=2603818 RepID=UPI001FE4A030|nr:hypothetical protein [Paraburkholderia panacisoli]